MLGGIKYINLVEPCGVWYCSLKFPCTADLNIPGSVSHLWQLRYPAVILLCWCQLRQASHGSAKGKMWLFRFFYVPFGGYSIWPQDGGRARLWVHASTWGSLKCERFWCLQVWNKNGCYITEEAFTAYTCEWADEEKYKITFKMPLVSKYYTTKLQQTRKFKTKLTRLGICTWLKCVFRKIWPLQFGRKTR